MLENMALQDSDDTPTATQQAQMPFARLVSTILSPAVVALPFIVLMALSTNASNILSSVIITIFFLCVGPMAYIVFGVITGKFTDADVSVRSQRVGPFLFGITSSLLGDVILHLTQGLKNLETVLLLVAICGLLMMIVTLWWKISMHASALGAALTALSMAYGKIILPAFVLLILVSWSRVRLKRHTLAQVIAGSIIGILLSWSLLKTQGF
ncbi:phosphatase PAP2 family protein [Dictyobacter arantiisoli]|uniref:Phosphatidic acid phosphatase type 2/haloperoxidase domain-containing protein n=1 Tax=Dictyobacter arantiisoli TaxID=2014874 RepID=A0A5A5TG45_9CHLR|nr:phosphatase PAP2 family protein [Dictyobacter arantiisoli]GCF10195.1 hypothetical protein KDI_37590 [Dictyobacter arantiisoli]